MENTKNYTKRFLIVISIIVLVDFAIKLIIVNTLQVHEEVKVIDNFFSIIRIHTVKLAYGLLGDYWIIDIVRFTFHVLIVLLTIRIQKRNVYKTYKYSTIMIVCGWIGNYLDRFLLAMGDSSYVQLDYLYFHVIGIIFNLSTEVILAGWILLIVSIVVRFRELNVIFSKEKSVVV